MKGQSDEGVRTAKTKLKDYGEERGKCRWTGI